MNSTSNGAGEETGSTDEFGVTRRAFLAASGAVGLSGLAGCSALDGLVGRASEQVLGTTVSAPAAFYPGRESADSSGSLAGSYGTEDGVQLFSAPAISDSRNGHERAVVRTGPGEVRSVPATARAEGREIELEGWSIGGVMKANDYNSVRSNKRRTDWWAGPDDELDDDDDGDILVDILDAELALLVHLTDAQRCVERREGADANRALDAFIDTTETDLRPALDSCGTGICETVRAHSDHRTKAVRRASDAVDEDRWSTALRELAGVEEIILADIDGLDDELVERYPSRPRFLDIIEYMRDEPTVGERFTVCLPDASLPGDRGSLAEELTPDRVLAYCVASHEPDGLRPPFHDQYGSSGISYDDEGCIQLDGPISLHHDISCGSVLTAELDSYRTENRAIVGHSIEGGAVVSGAPASADADGKCVFVAADGTLREARSLNEAGIHCWGQNRAAEDGQVYCWGQRRSDADPASQTLVCPVTVTPEDCPCPLPGLFWVRRCLHDDQVIFAGGWTLDEGALYEDSVTHLFDEGPTEIASVTAADVESGDLDDRIVEQFSRDRSEQGSGMIVRDLDGDGIPEVLQSGDGRRGLNAMNVKIHGEHEGENTPVITRSALGLDAPLVHLANASGTGRDVKFKAGAELSKSVN
ncbi:hypothetical protein [Natranaeroarchaeum aerophilus]|uniref:Uncharacterized protein n=1 Tax=Natranaeroarchaeum aerophilus TaxID=2917711 RepID=A0AAE3FQ96_9EURY|nr:hypothetical protein [Natranaeroarchaeum aerophilus]MCL9813125.1 hypothetical protein [Natranaeroarchaeum aerophilus]